MVGGASSSRPAGARGLKQDTINELFGIDVSRPAGARGLKHMQDCKSDGFIQVAPRRGAWIETI